MAKIGYARVSSKEQHLDRQLAALKDVDKLFTDKLSGANTNQGPSVNSDITSISVVIKRMFPISC